MRPPARVRRIQALIRLAAVVLAVLGAGALAVPAGAATLVINVRAADGRPLPGAVVTIRPLDGAPRKVAPVHAVMDQVNRAFAPDLLVIPVGSTVEFPNSDWSVTRSTRSRRRSASSCRCTGARPTRPCTSTRRAS